MRNDWKVGGIFVDITNQYFSVLGVHQGMRIDYDKYLAEMAKLYLIQQAYAFGSQMDTEANRFIEILKAKGFETRYRKADYYQDRPDIRRTDRNIPLAMEVWRLIDKLDVVIIGSSDPDLIPLVCRIKELGVQTIIFSCNIPKELREVASKSIEIDTTIMYRKSEIKA